MLGDNPVMEGCSNTGGCTNTPSCFVLVPCDGLASHPRGSSNAPSCFVLHKTDLNTSADEPPVLLHP